jgi:hypothetical protein
MGRVLRIAAVVTLIGMLAGCEPRESNIPPIAPDACYEFVDFKVENGQWNNEMFLYALRGPYKHVEFRALCLDIKARAKNEAFTFVVLFDKRENAQFPKDPFTAQYGMEEEKCKHIVAFYGMCKFNKYSELENYHPKNKWEGKAKREQL